MSELPYNRALSHYDYDHPALAPHVTALRAFEEQFRLLGAPMRKDHQHREWEYGNVMRQLIELGQLPDRLEGAGVFDGRQLHELSPVSLRKTRILDTGSGANYFVPYLKKLGYDITSSDSMAYGDCTDMLRRQCWALGVEIPLVVGPVEQLPIESDSFDVTLCISVIEHLPPEAFEAGLRELVRVTKPGGYLMITSDFFRDEASAQASPFIGCQHNLFVEANALTKVLDVVGADVEMIGGFDAAMITPPPGKPIEDLEIRDMLGIRYRGDFVNNYSFVNFCFRKHANSA